MVPEEASLAEWDDCMLLGLILFWIVGNLLFCLLSWRFGRGSGRQLACRQVPRGSIRPEAPLGVSEVT